jgi:predicted nucleic acid-binding protein
LSAVADASVIVAALVDTGARGEWAETVLQRGHLYAPELLRVETTNVLRRLERARKITEPEANAAYEDFMELDIELHPFEPFADRIWQLRHNLTCFDAWHLALAEALDLPMATLDMRLAKATGPRCPFLTPGSYGLTFQVDEKRNSRVFASRFLRKITQPRRADEKRDAQANVYCDD